MKIVVACDSFKGSLGSVEAGRAVAAGIADALPDARVSVLAIGDGGEGTARAIGQSLGCRHTDCTVLGPYGRPVESRIYINGTTAYIDVASAIGLGLDSCRDVCEASSAGAGQLIRCAMLQGADTIVVGLGGSATNDGGMGLLDALGAKFYDEADHIITPRGSSLAQVSRVNLDNLATDVKDIKLRVLSDVTNPLLGPQGATAVFGPQKGASSDDVARLERGMAVYAARVAEACGCDCRATPGAGAAGGIGFAMLSCLNARIESGIDTVLDIVGIDEAIDGADLIITGEGSIDRQTLMGKAPAGILARGLRKGVPVVALAGRVADADALTEAGFALVTPLDIDPTLASRALEPEVAAANVRNTARRIMGICFSDDGACRYKKNG